MKNKKLLATILALAVTSALLPVANGFQAKADELSTSDRYFLDFVSPDIGEKEIVYDSSPLYDETLTVNGYEYTFEVEGRGGYALIHEVEIAGTVMYEVEELAYYGESPFADCEGLPVYVTFRLYLDYINGSFYDLTTNTAIATEALTAATAKGFGYNGGGTFVEDSYTISYATKTVTNYNIPYDLPKYYGAEEASCANAAGAVVIGYYDQYCENLIPNFQVYLMIGSTKVYKSGGTEIDDLTLELYDLMGSGDSGTTFSGFQAGMNSYVQGKGYTYSTTSVFSNGAFNFNNYKTAVENSKPVLLFLDGYAIPTSITGSNGVDTIVSDVSGNTHVAVGCGYRTDTYYNASNNVISTQHYLRVATGLITYGINYLNMNAYGQINQAIAVTIQ